METIEIDHPMRKITQGVGKVKQQAHPRYIQLNKNSPNNATQMPHIPYINTYIYILLLFGEYLAAGSTPGAISLRKTKPC